MQCFACARCSSAYDLRRSSLSPLHALKHRPKTNPDVFDKLVSLCKRRGFIFQSSEIYGGTGSVWDYGPLGVELKKNIKDRWWNAMVRARDDIEGLDAAILMHPQVWEASGHVAGFTDPLVDCKTCKARFRADKLAGRAVPAEAEQAVRASDTDCQLTEPRLFNLMFKTFMGPVEDSAAVVYLRPETAQGIYVNFLNVQQSTRQKVPFGIAQIGKAFRNEITPGNFIFRTREFEQMEMQFFVEPGTRHGVVRVLEGRSAWSGTCRSGSQPERLQFHQHTPGGAGALRARRVRHRSSTSAARSASRRSRACTIAATSTSRSTRSTPASSSSTSTSRRTRRYVPYVIETSVGRGPHAARGARERLSRGGGRRRGRRPRRCSGFIRRSRRSRRASSRW